MSQYTNPMGNSSGELQSNYLNLLITQLRNQNPLDPMNNQEMAGQLAQMSQLKQLEGMNNQFGDVLRAVQTQEATGMLGREVTFMQTDSETGETRAATGEVTEASFGKDGVVLTVDGQQVKMDQITNIQ
ncbi:MAG: flagellar hook assembly protein FlgD [Planctomycetota bacterium]